jgi:hypothetical protein
MITFVDGENEWQGIYVDGKLVFENHQVSVPEFIKIFNKYSETKIEQVNADGEWTCQMGHFPEDLKDVKKA